MINWLTYLLEERSLCKNMGVAVEFRPYLARGLSYYNGSVFEIWSKKLGVSLCGGGSYKLDRVQATGISFGLEPIFLLAKTKGKKTKLSVISIEQDKESIRLAESFRDGGISVDLILNKSVKKAMEYANSTGVQNVLFVGDEEVKKKRFKVKNMDSGDEVEMNEEEVIRDLE